ncbi:MAG TPA: type I polyketide synthase, partial [Ruminiclostridium sp.]|nr:type I polyketide synthase [Ruminiclostridium sp.]
MQELNDKNDFISEVNESDIAIIGIAGRFPGADNTEEFWNNLKEGVESITSFYDEELKNAGVDAAAIKSKNYVKSKGIMKDVDLFDAGFFEYNPREAEIIDPQQRIFLECAWEALERAGYNPQKYNKPVSVFAGEGMSTYLLYNLSSNRSVEKNFSKFETLIGNDKDYLSTRVSYKLNLGGPAVNVSTACSTSLVAVHMGCLSLLNYECDMALAGGVTVSFPQKEGYMYVEGSILSPDGHCRPFDANAKGTVPGNGAGVVVLKRLEDAVRDRDNIYAVIKGSAINNDGSQKVGYTAPSVDGQAEVIACAQQMSGIEPETITYIETHGTGTQLGDPIEVEALTKAFRAGTHKKNFCAIGSVKSNVGHLDSAAGVTGLIKAALCLKNRKLVPSINYEAPNPQIDFENSPFYVNTKLADWKTESFPKRAGVSSFGIGGTNAHVVLEEAPKVNSSGKSRDWKLIVLSAKSQLSLDNGTEKLAEFLGSNENINLADAAYTLQVGRGEFSHRRIAICRDVKDAEEVLRTKDPQRVFGSSSQLTYKPVVFMFPGQGAQYINMGLELYRDEPGFRDEVDRCAEILKPLMGTDIRDILYPAQGLEEQAAARMLQTGTTQPVMFVVEYAMAKLWMEWGIMPEAMIGHSLGEYVAACLAGVFTLEEGLGLIACRGRLMQSLPGGSMLSVMLPLEEVRTLVKDRNLSVATVNGPTLCVVSGTNEDVELLAAELEEKGVGIRRLHTSHAFHSKMMEPILDEFIKEIGKVSLKSPKLKYISNLTGEWIKAEEATDPVYWARHMREAVMFGKGISRLMEQKEVILLEVGPGRTLSTFARQNPGGAGRTILCSMKHAQETQSDQYFILNTLGRLWLTGVEIDWYGFNRHETRNRVLLPTYSFDRQRYWIEPSKRNLFGENQDDDSLVKNPNISEWYYTPSWRQSVLT